MPVGQLEGVVRRLRTAALLGPADEGDGPLLERFLARRDEAAFEVLVRRHGPMVLGVCRRILGNAADADDAFQATFVVFVRKAASIRPRSRLGSWLYGVARKTALKAKAMNQKRRLKERQAASAVRPAPDATWAALLEVLDDELAALPEKYRAPIVLCDLEGLSYREASARLGCPQGTLSGRLTRARLLLARRLRRRGLSLSGGGLAAALTGKAAAAVSPSLLALTVRAGLLGTAGAASARILTLAEGVLKMMLLSKIKVASGVLLFVAVAAAAGWVGATRVSANGPTKGAGAEMCLPAPTQKPAAQRPESKEAEFVFLATEPGRKAVKLVVAGTTAPVLCLPLRPDLRILADERRLTLDELRPGTRIRLRMDVTKRTIQELRALPEGDNSPILPPAAAKAPPTPPSTAEVLRALPPVRRPGSATYEESRDDFDVVVERLSDKLDEPRFYPLVGPAQMRHVHWKCTVHYTETITSEFPFPFESQRRRSQVVYIDKDQLFQAVVSRDWLERNMPTGVGR
jgi:RNA polymerase sigma factor (sigma-70 family)